MNAFSAYSIVAGASALASFLIGFSIIKTLSQITDGGMWAIAAMVFAPALMGVGISAFIHRSHGLGQTDRRERHPLRDAPWDPGAFTSEDR